MYVRASTILIDNLIKTLGLEHDYKQYKTPAFNLLLQKYEDIKPFNGK